MKFVLAAILMMLMLTQTFSKWMVVMEYYANRDFIAKNLCVNKARPKMHCNGKCQMMKRLAEEEKQNSNHTGNTARIKIHEVVLFNETTQSLIPLLNYTTVPYNEEPPLLKYDAPASSIFHPPALG